MKCDRCNNKAKALTTAIIDGKFGQYCDVCRAGASRQADARSAQYARDRDRENHLADLVQPWDSKGKPSKEFIRLYPEEAKLNFSEEELEQYG